MLKNRLRSTTSLCKALVLSVCVHLLVLLIHFTPPKHKATQTAPLEVILVNAQSQKKPDKAKVLAQVALDGGGQTDKGRATTLPSQAQDAVNQRKLEAASARLNTLESIQRELNGSGLRFSESDNTRQDVANGTDVQTQRQLELKRLQAQIADNIKSYNERPRKHFFSPKTSPYEFAIYEEAWRMRVEEVGNQNYPEELKGKIYGKLRLTVYIKADGTLDNIEIDRSSGSAVLDRSALKILRMSAPFGPFPSEIRKKADILAITRTWVFSRDSIRTEY